MATPYAPPEWGCDGRNTFQLSLDVVRNGVLVESLSLPLDTTKSFVVAGRMEPLCDLVVQHPSLSRVHAVLQFDAHGALFVQDLKSTHGTFVNKKRIAPLQFQRLHVGDLLVFGESTRKYAVCGPEELRPEEADMDARRAKIQAKIEAQKKQEEREAAGASWGFGEDAEEDEDEDEDAEEEAENTKNKTSRREENDLPEYLRGIKEPGRSAYESTIKQSDVNEKDQKLFTQLQKKITKMEHLETEKMRILAKQNNLQGLTEGQEKTLERNNARIETLTKEIELLEERIHERSAQRDKSRAANAPTNRSKSKSSAAVYNYDSDEDDFYDRTSANQQKLAARRQQREQATSGGKTTAVAAAGHTTEVLTAEIIQRKIQMLEKDVQDLNVEYARVQADGGEEDVGGVNANERELDALEAFMQSTAKELHAKELARVQTRRQEVESELKKQRQLLAIALPAISHELSLAAAVKAPVERNGHHEAVISSPSPPSEAPTPAPVAKIAPSKPDDTIERADTPPREAGGEKEQRRENQLEPTLAPSPAQRTDDVAPAKPKKRRLMGPTLPPPATRASDAAVLEGGDRVWVPPADQTGDGRTKLNDKYGY